MFEILRIGGSSCGRPPTSILRDSHNESLCIGESHNHPEVRSIPESRWLVRGVSPAVERRCGGETRPRLTRHHESSPHKPGFAPPGRRRETSERHFQQSVLEQKFLLRNLSVTCSVKARSEKIHVGCQLVGCRCGCQIVGFRDKSKRRFRGAFQSPDKDRTNEFVPGMVSRGKLYDQGKFAFLRVFGRTFSVGTPFFSASTSIAKTWPGLP